MFILKKQQTIHIHVQLSCLSYTENEWDIHESESEHLDMKVRYQLFQGDAPYVG